jgi:hypothetical protein
MKMNAKQAKQIKMTDLMTKLGYEVKHIERQKSEYVYLSPLRAETTPSFKVSISRNLWFDFGAAEGGNILDFALLYLQKNGRSSRVSDALQWLEDVMGRPSQKSAPQFSFSPQKSKPESDASRTLAFVKDSPLKSEVILKYLSGRSISPRIAKKYLRVVNYRNTSQNASERLYFGFGHKNISGGWEVRSAADGKGAFKSALITRDITVHFGTEKGRGAVSVFEGMLDHLSLLEILGIGQLRGDAIILNSLSTYERAKAYILEKGYSRIDLFLDNNAAGQKGTARIIGDFGAIVTDHSPSYSSYEDLNDCLVAGDRPNFDTGLKDPQP